MTYVEASASMGPGVASLEGEGDLDITREPYWDPFGVVLLVWEVEGLEDRLNVEGKTFEGVNVWEKADCDGPLLLGGIYRRDHGSYIDYPLGVGVGWCPLFQ